MSKLKIDKFENLISTEDRSLISGPFGSSISSKFFVEEGIPVIRGNNLTRGEEKFLDEGFVFVTNSKAEELNTYAHRGDIVFTAVGTLGQVGIIDETSKYDEYVISNKQIRAKINLNKLDLLYAYYWLSSPWIQKYMEDNNKGSTVPLITLNEIRQIPIWYPESLIKQKYISSTLDLFTNKIKNNNYLNNLINEQIKSLYNYWFTQFDFPNESGQPYKSSGGKMVWNEKLKRDIPEGWEVKNIEELVLYEKGFEPGAKNYSDEFKEGYLPFYRVGELGSGVPIYTPNFDTIRESQIANFGDVLISFDGSIGRISVSVDGVFSSGIQKATSIVEYINDALIYTISKNDYFQQVLDRHATGSIIKHASNSKKYLDLPIDKDIMLEFSKTIKPLFDKIILLEKENLELIKQRDFLLPLLMNGQVTIK